jgi:DNA-binding transcriptional MerR regulator
MYTVNQLSRLAGISRRTLHYYDEIGLLPPTELRANGYRYYDDAALLRLQQILFYRELDLPLEQIREILDDPKFDTISALQIHRREMQAKIERLETLIGTVDRTILHIIGEVDMKDKKNIFEGFSEEKQREYEAQAVELWGDTVKESTRLWNSYSEAEKKAILEEAGEIYQAITANMERGPQSPEIQAQLARWHANLRFFYEPSIEVLAGLGQMYHDHPDFNATFTAIHPDLPAFLKEAIAHYVDVLETRWLEKELGILEDSQ